MLKLLLVDDEQIERMTLAKKINKYYGDRVIISQASDGREAVRIFENERSDIVIMDISMPEMNGVMAAKIIRSQDENCSIIFMSAYDDFEYTRKAIKVKALDYLLKPCELNDLLAVMDVAIHQAQEYQNRRNGDSLDTVNYNNNTEFYSTAEIDNSMLDREFKETKEFNNTVNDSFEELAVAQRMKKFIDINFMNDISMQDAARNLGYSDAYFSKMFKQYFNQNFTAYLTEYRIDKAKDLLLKSNVSIRDISRMVGYTDSNYFAKIFKRIEGSVPSKYREDMQNAQ